MINNHVGEVAFYCGGGATIGNSFSLLKFGDYFFGMDWGGGYQPNLFKEPKYRSKLDCLLFSHAHYDHIGMGPFILKRFPNLRLIATEATRDLCELSWRDTLKLTSKNGNSPFSQREIDLTLKRIETIKYGKELPLNNEVSLFPLIAGHILGSVSPLLTYKGEAFFMTSDICLHDRSLLEGAKVPHLKSSRLLVRESTYINTSFEPREKRVAELVSIVKKVFDRGGKVLIPALSIDRAQDIFTILNQNNIPNIYLEGAKGVTEVYARYLGSKALAGAKRVNNQEERREVASSSKSAVIIATSGNMIPGTLSSYWAKELAPNLKNAVVMVSYHDPHSEAGRFRIAKKGHFLFFGGNIIVRNCEVYDLNFSAHMSGDEGRELEERLNPKTIIYNHGSRSQIEEYINSKRDEKRRIVAKVGEWVKL